MKKHVLANNQFYRKWSNQRDEAAEALLDNSKHRTTEITDRTLVRVIEMIHARYSTIKENTQPMSKALQGLDHSLTDLFDHCAYEIYIETLKLREKSWLLSHMAEAFVVSLILKKKMSIKASMHDVQKVQDQDPKLQQRIQLAFGKLRHRVLAAVMKSIVLDEDVTKAIGRVYLAFPKKERMTKIKKLKRLQKVKEAGVPRDFDPTGTDALTFSNQGELYDWQFDSTTWKKLLDDYNTDYLPVDRSPANVFDIRNPFNDEPVRDDIPSNEAFYGWEVEQETTHDFVTAVRQGEISAAKENGVDDFMWIAIIDKKTCEVCCEWRDGLSSSEIQQKLDDDPGLAEACDAIVPSAHFNCRCRVSPISSKLEPFEPEQDVQLDDWLQSL